MEPILPEPNLVNPGDISSGSQLPPETVQYAPESAPNTQPEKPHETPPVVPMNPVAQQGTPVVPVQAPISQQAGGDNSVAAGTNPVIADDVDVIEKEWVDKAKKIVELTKSDPHQQEKEVSKLQADYLSKRYNKQIKLSE